MHTGAWTATQTPQLLTAWPQEELTTESEVWPAKKADTNQRNEPNRNRIEQEIEARSVDARARRQRRPRAGGGNCDRVLVSVREQGCLPHHGCSLCRCAALACECSLLTFSVFELLTCSCWQIWVQGTIGCTDRWVMLQHDPLCMYLCWVIMCHSFGCLALTTS